MYKEILNEKQTEVLKIIQKFKAKFYLGGGTAIALQLGHRRSVDFDLFSPQKIQSKKIIDLIGKNIDEVLTDNEEEFTCIFQGVKITFLHYPFEIKPKISFENIIKMPSLLDLAATKAYTLGRRNELKDYIDLYFLLKEHFSLNEIESQTKKIFKNLFSEKLFRSQLVYFDDLDFSQKIDFLKDKIKPAEIKSFFVKLVQKEF